jgi:hypothetical protein
MNTATLHRVGSAAAALIALIGLTACAGPSVARDHDDATPPAVTLEVAATPNGGLVAVADGSLVTMVRGIDITVLATGADPGGVSAVELWVSPTRHCASVGALQHGLSVAPAARTAGPVTATEAPLQLTTTYTLSGQIPPDCTITYDVAVRAGNAADRPVQAPFISARFMVPIAG